MVSAAIRAVRAAATTLSTIIKTILALDAHVLRHQAVVGHQHPALLSLSDIQTKLTSLRKNFVDQKRKHLVYRNKSSILAIRNQTEKTMIQSRTYNNGDATMRGVFLNVPVSDWTLLEELIRKFGWQSETREQLIERFCSSRPQQPTLSDEEIMEEVKAARYEK